MKYIVISDIHENFNNLFIALEFAKVNSIGNGFILGDLINPGIVHQLGRSLIKFDIIIGNNDGDIFMLYQSVLKFNNLNIHNLYYEQNIDGLSIFLTHLDKIGDLASKSGDYNAVFCGHNHRINNKLVNKCLLANPGELSGHMFGKPTFGIWDSIKNKFEIIEIINNWIDVKKFKRNNFIVKKSDFRNIKT